MLLLLLVLIASLYVSLLVLRNDVLHSFVALLSVHLLGFIIHKLVVYPFFLSPLRNLPQPPGFKPLVGHILTLIDRSAGAPHLRIMKNTPNNGLVRTLGLFHTDRLILTSPKSLADVLVHKNYDFEKPAKIRGVLRRLIGDGLLMSEGDRHKHHRKLLIPAFHYRRIQNFYSIFWKKSIELCGVAKMTMETTASEDLDINPLCTKVALDVIGLAGIGRDLGSLRSQDDDLAKLFEDFLEPTAEKAAYFRCHLILPQWLTALLPWEMHKTINKTADSLRKRCGEFVSERRSMVTRHDAGSNDVLSTLIKSSDLSDACLVEHTMTLFAAG
jgi:cytochrome P450